MALPTFTPGTMIKASEMNQALATLFDMAHPVGSYYETSDANFDPNNAWPGTWVEDTAGRVLVAQDSATFATVGNTGGEEKHTLIGNELPKSTFTAGHIAYTDQAWAGTGAVTHTFSYDAPAGVQEGINSGTATRAKHTFSFGNDTAHNNLQPYIVVKRWHRTA